MKRAIAPAAASLLLVWGAGCGSGTASAPAAKPAALVYGPMDGPLADALAPWLDVTPFGGAEDPASYDLVVVDASFLPPGALDDGGAADAFVDAAMEARTPVLLLDASEDEARGLLEEHGVHVAAPSRMIWVEPGVNREGHRIVQVPRSLLDLPAEMADDEWGDFAIAPSSDGRAGGTGGSDAVLVSGRSPAEFVLKRLEERRAAAAAAVAAPVAIPDGLRASAATTDCEGDFNVLTSCLKSGMAYKRGSFTLTVSTKEHGWCLKGANFLDAVPPFTRFWDPVLPGYATGYPQRTIWKDDMSSVLLPYVVTWDGPRPGEGPAQEPLDRQCPTALVTVDYFVFLRSFPDGTKGQIVILQVTGLANPKGEADNISADWDGRRLWYLSGLRVTAQPSWEANAISQAGMTTPRSSPSNFRSSNASVKVSSEVSYSFDFKGSAGGECSVGAKLAKKPSLGPECGVSAEASLGGKFGFKSSTSQDLTEWKVVNDSNAATMTFRWNYSQFLPYEGYPRKLTEVGAEGYQWFIVPWKILPMPVLSRRQLDTTGYASFEIEPAQVGQPIHVNLTVDMALDATLCGRTGLACPLVIAQTVQTNDQLRAVITGGGRMVIDLGSMTGFGPARPSAAAHR